MALFGFKKQIIGLDIGSDSLKAAVVEISQNKSQLIKFIQTPIINNTISTGEIIQPEALKDSIVELFKKLKLSKSSISLGLAGSAVMVKKVSIPKMEQHLIADQVRWEAEQYIPFDLSSVNLDYVILETGAGQDTESMEVLIVAAQQDYIRRLVETIQAVQKSDVMIVDVNGFALANAFTYNYGKIQGQAVALIDIGAFYTHFVVVQNGEVVFCRDLPVGGTLINQEIQSVMEVNYNEAEKFKISPEGQQPEPATQAIKNCFETICDQIQGSFEFFLNTTQGVNVTNIFLTGSTSYISGLSDALQQTLDIPCEFLDPLRNIDVKDPLIDVQHFKKSGAVSLGLALRKVGDND